MVLMCEPVVRAIESVKTEYAKVYLTSPQGQVFNDHLASDIYNSCKHLILVCGHYEGFDERIKNFVDGEISIGDYVLTGGELPAMSIIDSIVRLLPGVLGGGTEATAIESYSDEATIEYPQYTRPEVYNGQAVPEVLLSGNHALIAQWRKEHEIK